MSQIPQRQIEDVRSRLLNQELERSATTQRQLREQANPFSQAYRDSNFAPTFEQPTTGFFGSIANRLLVGSEELNSVGAGIIRSFAERGFGAREFNLPAPYIDGNDFVVLDNKIVPSSEASLDDVWEALGPVEQNILKGEGKDLQTLQRLQITDGKKFADWYQLNAQVSRAQQSLQAYSESNPVLSGVSAGATLGVNALTDLVFLTSLVTAPFTGGTSLGAAGAQQTARTGARLAARRILSSSASKFLRGTLDPVTLATREVVEGGAKKALLTRAIITSAGASYGGTYATVADAGAQTLANELGNQDPEYVTRVLPAVTGITLGGAISFWTTRGVFSSANKSGVSQLAGDEASANSLALVRHLSREQRLGRVTPPDPADIASADMVESILGGLYNGTAISRVTSKLFGEGRGIDEVDLPGLARFLTDAPTVKELDEFLERVPGSAPPTTRYRELTDELEDLSESLQNVRGMSDKEINKMSRRYNTVANELSQHVRENYVLDIPQSGVTERLRTAIKDRPVSALPSEEDKVQALAEILVNNTKKYSDPDRSRSLVSHLHKFGETKAGKFLLVNLLTGPKMKAKAAVASDDPAESIVGRLFGLLDNKGMDNSEVFKNADGVAVKDTLTRQSQDMRYSIEPVFQEIRALKKAGVDDRTMFEALGNTRNSGADLPDQFRPLYDKYISFLEEIGDRAVESGTFERKLENFFNIAIASEYDSAAAEAAVRAAYKKVYAPLYDVNNPSSAVNYNTLKAGGYIDDDFTIRINPDTERPYFDEIPTKVSEIPKEILPDYTARLDQSLDADSLRFFQRRARDRNLPLTDSDEFRAPVRRTNSIDPSKSRVADQRIYLDSAVLDSGFVSTDLNYNIRSYHQTTGYRVNRDAAVSEAFGDRVTWGTLDASLDRIADTPAAKEAVTSLRQYDSVVSRRFRTNSEGAQLAGFMNVGAAASITGKVGISILPMEVAGQYTRALIPRRNIIDNVRALTRGFRQTFNKEELRMVGILHESDMHDPRFISNITEQLPDKANTRALHAARGGSHFLRTALGERALTSHARIIAYNLTFHKLHKVRKKLDRLQSFPQGIIEGKEFNRLARELGIDKGELRMLQNAGILQPESISAARRALAVDSKALISDNRLLKVAADTGDEGILELWRKLNTMALRDAETFVLRPTPADVKITKDPIANLLFSMTSFVNGFYGTTLTRVGNSPYALQLGFFSFLLGSQIVTNVMRDILYNGESPDTVMDKWEEDPIRELALAVSMLPVQGPVGVIPTALFAYGIGGDVDRAVEGTFAGVTPGIMGRFAQTVYSTAHNVVTGEESSEADRRNLELVTPGYNSFILRILEETAEGFEEDDDR